MKRVLWILTAASLFLPCLAWAQKEFDGTWKIDMNKVDFPKKPDVMVLQNGVFQCKTCVPPVEVKADGQDHKVTGHPYYDTIAITVVNDRTVEQTEKKNGKTVSTEKMTVSADGKTMVTAFSDSSYSTTPVTGKAESTRVDKGPAGSNAISGSWRTTKVESLSENAITWTFKVNGDELSMSTPTGQSYTAKINGPEAPMKGDPGTTSVSVKMVGKDTLEETDLRNGKVIGVGRWTVTSDGKMLHAEYEDKLHGTTTKSIAMKQ